MSKFFEVVVAVELAIQKNGKPKIAKEVYLVDAMSVTEAEARVVQDFSSSSQNIDYQVLSAKPSKVLRVIE